MHIFKFIEVDGMRILLATELKARFPYVPDLRTRISVLR